MPGVSMLSRRIVGAVARYDPEHSDHAGGGIGVGTPLHTQACFGLTQDRIRPVEIPAFEGRIQGNTCLQDIGSPGDLV